MPRAITKAERRRAMVQAENQVQPRARQGEAGHLARFHKDGRPVRLCTTACVYRQENGPGCWHFRFGKARDGELCVPELNRLAEWGKAFRDGEDEKIKRDAGYMLGALYNRARLMLEQIDREGLTVRAPKVDRLGDPILVPGPDGVVDYVWEVNEHPLWSPLLRIVKQLGMSLPEFGLTPKARADQAPEVHGRINIEKIDMKVIVQQQADRTRDFLRALELGNEMRQADPVYRQFAEPGLLPASILEEDQP